MTTQRRSPTLVRLVGAVLLGCAAPGSVGAEERVYPPKYSNRKPAWYDITSWFDSSDEKKDDKKEDKTPADKIPETKRTLPAPMPAPTPVPMPPVTPLPVPAGNGIAWNWYGYGAPTPGANPHAPQGSYEPVPPAWHLNAGTTPGAIPLASLKVAAPFTEPPRQTSLTPSVVPPPVIAPPPTQPAVLPAPMAAPITTPTVPTGRKPILPEGGSPYSLVKPPTELLETPVPKIAPDSPPILLPIPAITKPDNIDWRPARLAIPLSDTPSDKPVVETPITLIPTAPLATLRKPTTTDGEPTKPVERTPEPERPAPPTPTTPTTTPVAPPPGVALPSRDPGTPDIPVNPAPGIRLPD